ncbi:hypothetical protein F2Q69_00045115 [Brassica cretica]|uniref:Uncharacterized protein n=1 Tax=Brassica cretica TaxID=69181 RepID=A0A8S9NJC0_BRACR|nr:hypothetical protein F2Q69_00045115 [Brassica cretica]
MHGSPDVAVTVKCREVAGVGPHIIVDGTASREKQLTTSGEGIDNDCLAGKRCKNPNMVNIHKIEAALVTT